MKIENNMKIGITGATGFIGSHITDKFVEEGHQVFVIARSESNVSNINKQAKIINVNLYDIKDLSEKLKEIEIIIHCAGALFGKNYDYFYKSNVQSTINLISALKTNNNFKQFIFISSLTAVGPSKSLEKAVNEESIRKPITNYGRSKAEAEEYIESQKDWLNYTIFRLPAVFGPRDKAIYSIFKIANIGLGSLIGFNKKYLSLVYSQDIINVVNLSINNPVAFKEVFFLSNTKYYSWIQIMDILKKKLNKKLFVNLRLPHFLVFILGFINSYFSKIFGITPIFNVDKARDFTQQYWICDNTKVREKLKYDNFVNIETAFEETIKWYKENKWL